MIRFSRLRTPPPFASALLALAGWACADPTGPAASLVGPSLELVAANPDLGPDRTGSIEIRNVGADAIGPIRLDAGQILNGAGHAAIGPRVTLEPAEFPVVPGRSAVSVTLRILDVEDMADDRYRIPVAARGPGSAMLGAVQLSFVVADHADTGIAEVRIAGPPVVRRGDVVPYTATASDAGGADRPAARRRWRVEPPAMGVVTADGRFVAYGTGPAAIVVGAGFAEDTLAIAVGDRDATARFDLVGRGVVDRRFTSDLWVHGTTAYTGTWGVRTVAGRTALGNTMHAWDVRDPARPVRTGSVEIDARVVNDVKIDASGAIAVITHEGSADARNGVTLLALDDPRQPRLVGRFTESLETGVHNAFIDGHYLYLAVDGISPTSGLRVLDIRDPARPLVVSRFYAGNSFLHDVYVREGLAFLSHWNAGLVILDVGHGIAGGSPERPAEVSRLRIQGGQTHNVWYWPETGYAFVGEEDFTTPGILHVVDVRDLRRPREVATYRVPDATPHNVWLDENAGVLYASWYEMGIRAVDVTGELMGELDKQGRELGSLRYGDRGPSGSTRNWAPQVHDGLVYLADMNTGLWIFRPIF